MPDRIADGEPAPQLAVEQDGEQVVGNDFLDDLGEIRQNAIQVECLRSHLGDLEQKIEQFGAVLEHALLALRGSGRGCLCGGHQFPETTIFTLALAPIRLAPAATMLLKSSLVRMPPEALTPIAGPTMERIKATSCVVAPEGPKPV